MRCQLDTSLEGPCTTPTTQAYTGLAFGSHTFTVRAIDAAGNSSSASYTWMVTAQPPANTVAPTVSGQAVVGHVLTASPGTWTGNPPPTFTYQWQDCDANGLSCVPIGGATAPSYTVAATDVGSKLLVVVTGTNPSGSSSAASAPTSVVPQPATPPVNTIAPVVSGQAVVGQLVSTTSGSWSGNPPPSFGYQWQDCDANGLNCAPISGATGSSHTVEASDLGFTLVVVVTATNASGSSSASSTPTSVVSQPASPPVNTAAPSISGQPVVGQVLSTSDGTWTGSPAPSFGYQWQDCDSSGVNCAPIGGATASSYTVAASDIGFTLVVVVTGTNGSGSSSASSAATAVVPDPSSPPVNTVAPAVSGQAVVGQVLSASDGTWTGTPAPSFGYQWQDCDSNGLNCAPIGGATASSYTVAAGDVGSTLVIVVTGTNTSGSSSASSAATAVVTQAGSPPVNTAAPVVSGQAAVGQVLSASTGTWRGLRRRRLRYQWQDCDANGVNCVPIGGATSSSYTVAAGDVGSTLVIVVTGTNASGSSSAGSSPTSVVPSPGSPPVNTVAPVVTGQATVGQVLSASTGTWTGSPAPSFGYQWQDCDANGVNCVPIGGATSSSYTVAAGDVGSTLVIVVTGTNASGSSSAGSSPTSVVPSPGSPPVNTVAPVVTGQATVGQVLSASTGTWTGSPAPSFALSVAGLRRERPQLRADRRRDLVDVPRRLE